MLKFLTIYLCIDLASAFMSVHFLTIFPSKQCTDVVRVIHQYFPNAQAGTYFWHGHYNAQRTAGLYGLLIVDQRLGAVIPTYDGEFAITVNDWWQMDVYDQTHGLDNYQNWTWVGAPQSFLIKGDSIPCQKYVSCPSAEIECNTNKLQSFSKTQGGSGAGKLIWNVLPGKTYLVRIASVTSSAFLNFVIEGHTMTVIEADGHMIQPFNTTSIDILSGQTYAFNFTTKGPEYPDQRVYHIGVNARDSIADSKNANGTDPGLAVLSYNFPNINQTVTPSPTDATTLWDSQPVVQQGGPRWNDTAFGYYFANQIQAQIGYSYPVPMREDVTLAFVIHQMRINDANNNSRFVMRWALNNISYYSSENIPLLARLMNSSKDEETEKPLPQIDSSDFKELVHLDDITGNQTLYRTNTEAMRGGYYLLKSGDIVTVVLQNSATYNTSASEAHPWHLHGHDFWVLGYGDGLYDPDTSPQGFNLQDPPVRNTVPVFDGGWVAIRFIADNPGVWSFHCHNEWHMYLGMKVVFAYGVDDIPRPNPGEDVSLCH
jgi:L-ascorbate oxidase